MRCLVTGLVILAVAALGGPGHVAFAAGQKAVTATAGWIQAPAAADTTAAAFVVIDNPTMYDVYVVAGATDIAGQVQFREANQPSGANAKPLAELTVPAFGALEMKPGGVHVLLMDLKRPLKPGETISLTFTTDTGVALKVPAVVRDK